MFASFGKKAVVCLAICFMISNSTSEEVPNNEYSDSLAESTISMDEMEVEDEPEQMETPEKSVNEELFPFDFMSLAKTLNPFNDFKRTLRLQQEFNLADFQGTWYEIARNVIASLTFELGCKDTYANYSAPIGGMRETDEAKDTDADGRVPEIFFPPLTPVSAPYVDITNTCTRLGIPSAVMGKAFVVSPQLSPGVFTEGRLEVKFGMTADKLPTACVANQTVACPGNYWVLWTDYANLAVIGGPVPFGSVWFLSRHPEVPVSDILYMKMKALEAGVSVLELLPGALVYSTPTSTKV